MTESACAPSTVSGPADAGTLAQLELHRALEEIARRAAGPLGADAVRARLPSSDLESIRHELTTVAELRDLLAAGDPFRPEPIQDIRPLLHELRAPGAVLDGQELLEIGRALEAMRIVRGELTRVAERAPKVGLLAVETPPARLGRDLLGTFEPDGRVRDGADAAVDRARSRVRDARTRLIQTLERVLRGLASHETSTGASVTMRSGRYVIPVHADARGRVPGIVHAESASGATLFVEPQGAVELGNALAAAEADEARAVHAVLRRLSDEVRPHADTAEGGLAMCIAADDLYARARYAVDVAGEVPRVGAPGGRHVLRGARHPLLLAEGVAAVPFDLELEPSEFGLVVSGPNTGGKTVLLKAVGLITTLVQAGVVPPVGDGSELPVYSAIVADIGDRQSIADNLSTFSAHLAAVRGALEVAGPGSLALLDEIGSGTDPVEGAALAAAVLETLVARQGRVVATTHLGDLKKVAAETPGVVNASLAFDAANLTPTYELVKGVPGRSYGLVMAKRLGLDSEVIDKAEARRPAAERSLDTLLAEVEQRAATLSEHEAEATARLGVVVAREARLAAREKTVEETEHAVRERQGALEREGREQARRFLLEARKRVEEALGMARAAVSEATAKEARRLVEEGISEEGDELRRLQDELARKGWRVKGKGGDATQPGRVEHRGGMRAAKPREEHVAPATKVSPPPATAPISEVDLRGMDAEEARDAVMRAVDAAVLADLPVVRLIHGKGTGVLRRVVDEALRADARVAEHRLAPPREGGTGVTIAELA